MMRREAKRTKKKIFYVSLAAVLMLLAVAPAMASQPKMTYMVGGITYPDPANPGTQFTTGDILHARDHGILGFTTGSPWGAFTTVATQNFELNLVSYTGTLIAHYVNTNSRATFGGIQNTEFDGVTTSANLFIYHGPTFTVTTTGGVSVTISEGKLFTGLLFSGMGVAHGIADGKDVQVRTTFTGISLSGPLTYGLAGDSIVYGTVTYWYTGN